MAAMAAATARRFARFDAELQDSDQTITGMSMGLGTRGGGGRDSSDARGLPLPLRRMRQPPRLPLQARASTFFPDSTDDDEHTTFAATARAKAAAPLAATRSRDALARSYPRSQSQSYSESFSHSYTGARTRSRAAVTASSSALVPIGDVQFPLTRSVLWDRRVLAGPFHVRVNDVLPHFVIACDALKRLHALATQAAASGEATTSQQLGWLSVDDTDTVNKTGPIMLTRVIALGDEENDHSQRRLPVFNSSHNARDDNRQRHLAVERARSALEGEQSVSSTSMTALVNEANVFVSTSPLSGSGSRAELEVKLETTVPCAGFHLKLIRNLPLLLTPLASSLSRCELGAQQTCGFVTLDRARKAVPLLESDPLVHARPLVGIWVYGVNIDETEAGDEADRSGSLDLHVRHPFLYRACVRFLSTKLIKERVFVEKDTFLVVVYSGKDSTSNAKLGGGPLPRFFEVSVTQVEFISGDDASKHATPNAANSFVKWKTTSVSGRCLAGVSSFRGSLDLKLKTDEKITRIDDTNDSENEVELTSFKDATEDANTGTMYRSRNKFWGSKESKPQVSASNFNSRIKPASDRQDDQEVGSDAKTHEVQSELQSRLKPFVQNQAFSADMDQTKDLTDTPRHVSEDKTHQGELERSLRTTPIAQSLSGQPPRPSSVSEEYQPTRVETNAYDIKRTQGHDEWSNNSCCRSQQILALQHQHILENQQRQLRQMQQQIERLQQLLNETRRENERLVAESHSNVSSRHTINDPVADTQYDIISGDDRQQLKTSDLEGPMILENTQHKPPSLTDRRDNEGGADSASSVGDLSSDSESDIDADADANDKGRDEDTGGNLPVIEHDPVHESESGEDGAIGNTESGVSSLKLSSISHHSARSNVSSLSSSLVGDRLKRIIEEQHRMESSGDRSPREHDPQHPKNVASVDNEIVRDDTVTDVRWISARSTRISDEIDFGKIVRTKEYDDGQDPSKATGGECQCQCNRIPDTSRRSYAPHEGRCSCKIVFYDDDDGSSADMVNPMMSARLIIPQTPPKDRAVPYSVATLHSSVMFADSSSFSIPRIQYATDPATSDSEDDEIRRIELKYNRRPKLAHHL